MASYLFAPDSFKGSLTSRRACQILQEELASTDPDSSARSVCIGDGGEGTLDAIVAASGGSLVSEVVSGPLGRPVRASYGRMRDGSAVVELASASGLPLLSMEERSPRLTSTYGTGQLIGRAMAAGARHIVVSLGGSATNDGGMGAMRALGVRFCDSQGEQLEGRGCDLARVRKIDLDDIDPLVAQTTFDVLCDVDNPLVGSRGATRVFSAQKGATPADVIELEHGMQSFSQVLQETFGRDVASVPGAGAEIGRAHV